MIEQRRVCVVIQRTMSGDEFAVTSANLGGYAFNRGSSTHEARFDHSALAAVVRRCTV